MQFPVDTTAFHFGSLLQRNFPFPVEVHFNIEPGRFHFVGKIPVQGFSLCQSVDETDYQCTHQYNLHQREGQLCDVECILVIVNTAGKNMQSINDKQ